MITRFARTTVAPLILVAVLAVSGCTPHTPDSPPPGRAASAASSEGEVLASGDFSLRLPLGLQAGAAYVPENNPLSQAKIDLGRLLYFDPRLSRDGTISCATCHAPEKGFSDARPTSAGIDGRIGGRNSPTVMNRLFSAEQFWDGRSPDLEDQALGPIQNPIEMGHTLPGMLTGLRNIPGYGREFEAAFGDPEITAERVARAIASYERTVLAGNAPYDRYQAGGRNAMSAAAVRGMELFNDARRGNCVTCHAGFNFTDESYHNLGVGMDGRSPDVGRYEITRDAADRGAFKTPTLRNIAETAPYMHDGSEATLADVVAFYDRGGKSNRWLSQEIRPLHLTTQEMADLLAFLQALTGEVRGGRPPSSFP